MGLFDRLDALGRRVARAHVLEDRHERIEAVTRDGWRLGLLRVRPRGASRGPVLLVHGLGANHHAFLIPGRSLAEHLAELGFDCFVADLRGAGISVADGVVGWDWDLHDHVALDVPALIDAVLSASGAASLLWVGHSLGGMLLYLLGIDAPGDSRVRAGVTLAATLDYRVGRSTLRELARLRGLLGIVPRVPQGSAARIFGRLGFPVGRMASHPGSVDPELLRHYLASVNEDVAPRLLSALATTFGKEGLLDRAGEPYLPRAARFSLPLLALAGDADVQCSPAAVAATVEGLGSADKATRVIGPGCGHIDLVIGRRAPDEAWPAVVEFLTRHSR